MTQPQAIMNPLTRAALFLVLTISPGGEAVVRDVLSGVSGLRRSIGFRIPDGDLSCVAGIGSHAWDRLFSGPRPAGLHPFSPLTGPVHSAPATPGDLLFHIRGETADICFELGKAIVDRLGDAARIVDETIGFRYFEQRDLLGFVDGTENPEGADAIEAAIVGDEDPDFAGGSYVIVQKYLHDMSGWEALTIEAQERVIGRTKLEDFEYPEQEKAPDAHIMMAKVVDPDGTEHDIVRANMPFGSLREKEFGTYFIGYAASPEPTEIMLQRMFLGADGAAHDRILDFSEAVTGTLFFCPPAGMLDAPPPPPSMAVEVTSTAEYSQVEANSDGSLALGSLKGQAQ